MDRKLHIWVPLLAFPTEKAFSDFASGLSNAFEIASAINSATKAQGAKKASSLQRTAVTLWRESPSEPTGWISAPTPDLLVVEDNVSVFKELVQSLAKNLSINWIPTTISRSATSVSFVIEKAKTAFTLERNEHSVIWNGSIDQISFLSAAVNLFHLDNVTLATQSSVSSDAVRPEIRSLAYFNSSDEIHTWFLPHLLAGAAKLRFWLVFPDSTRLCCNASPRAVNATFLPINLGLGCKKSWRAKASLAEAGDPVLEVTGSVSASGICQSVFFGAQPLVADGDCFGSDNRRRFAALCLSLREKGWALMAKAVAGCARVALLPTLDGRLVMQNVLTHELLLPLPVKKAEPEAEDAGLEEALDRLDYADYYDPLEEDGRVMPLLNQRTQTKRRGRPKTLPPPTSHDTKRPQGQGARLLKKLQFSVSKP